MALNHQILFGKVMHKRLFPAVNHFIYSMYYLFIPISQLGNLPIPHNRFGMMSFYDNDHGARDGSDLELWARSILEQYNIQKADGEIILICLPRIFSYVFNPVSFWLCLDVDNNLRAVLCEVNNTFGERHTYVCAHSDHSIIQADDILEGEKIFHVSPFLERQGHYQFQFRYTDKIFSAHINYFNDGKKQLLTSLHGRTEVMNTKSLRWGFVSYPLITLKTIGLIHWQALKLIVKKISYIHRPEQESTTLSSTHNLTKN